jgi:hypothetical protein
MGRDSKSMMGTVGTIPVHWLVAVAFVYALALGPSPTLVAAGPGVVASAASSGTAMSQCDNWELCNTSAACDTPCLADLFETTCGEYQGGIAEGYCAGECGDGYCNTSTESRYSCPDDCGGEAPETTCGDSVCEDGESWMSCPADCPTPPPSLDICGNNKCETTEDPVSCPEDCDAPEISCSTWPCPNGYDCVDGQCVYENATFPLCGIPPNEICGVGENCKPINGAFRCVPDPWA